ncbi:MAG: ATP synthase F1 subunit delta [Actinobacteria bacterium]|nr:ATP synthase F1 subunit delta [Actinomycetota bacterium]
MGESNITNVYAQALFEAARDAGTLEATAADLKAFSTAMEGSRELTAVMLNPRINSVTKKKVVAELTEGGDRIFVNGINLIIDKRHSDLLVDLNERFQKLLQKENGIVEVEITSAVELPEETRAGIRKRIEDAIGKKVDIKETVRADILGGLVLRFGDVIVDSSLQAKLEQLRVRLAQANIGSE